MARTPWNKKGTNADDLAEDDGEGWLDTSVENAWDAAHQDVLPLRGVHAHQAGEGRTGQVLFLLLHTQKPSNYS